MCEVARLEAELLEERRERAAQRSLCSVLDLEGDPETVSHGAEKAFGAALGHPPVAEAHQLRVGCTIPANELRVRPHRIGGPNATLDDSIRENACAIRSSGSA